MKFILLIIGTYFVYRKIQMIDFDEEKCINELKNDGITIINNAIDKLILADLIIKFNKVINLKTSNGSQIGSTEENEMIWIDHPLALDRNLIRLVASNKICNLITKYLGTDIQFSYSFAYRTKVINNLTPQIQSLIKKPGVFKGWHSDANISSEKRGYRCVVVMLYLSDVEVGDGGLWVVKGSHTYGGSKREWDESQLDSNEILEVVAKSGSIIIFDMEMIHRAGTPTRSIPRDIIRFMYTPLGGYSEDYLIPASFIDSNLSDIQRKILNFSTTSPSPVPCSEVRVKDVVKDINFIKYMKKQLIKLLI